MRSWRRAAVSRAAVARAEGADGRDLRKLPLVERKRMLESIVPDPKSGARIFYARHIEQHGTDFFRMVCDRDLEGIVAKWKHGPYDGSSKRTTWVKVKNPTYSQAGDRLEAFQKLVARVGR